MSRRSVTLQAHFESAATALIPGGATVCVGLSGGLDSVVLLHLFHAHRSRYHLQAVHVHHGLSANADAWADFCATLCNNLDVPLRVERVTVDRASGLGIEASARSARHAVYSQVDADAIALAHHADDAAETLLLRLLRGTGILGLQGMRATRDIDARRRIVRPLIGVRRAMLETYAREAGLRWIEDESNLDVSLDRNFLRHEIVPRLSAHFPPFPASLLRASDHAAEAQLLLDELADLDLMGQDLDSRLPDNDVEGGSARADSLSIARVAALTAHRARNALRRFVSLHGLKQPDAAKLAEMTRQIQSCEGNAQLAFELDGHQLKRHRDRMIWADARAVSVFQHEWRGESSLFIPELRGRLEFEEVEGSGIALNRTREGRWTVQSRSGGESLRLHADGPRRTLKNLFQEAGVPAWERSRQPYLLHEGKLVWTPLAGIDVEYRAGPGEAGRAPVWVATPPDR